MQASDIEAQIQKLRNEIADLAKTVASASAETVESYRTKAEHAATDALHATQTVFDGMRTELVALEQGVATRIRSRPLQALGLAVGVGVLIALISRRAPLLSSH